MAMAQSLEDIKQYYSTKFKQGTKVEYQYNNQWFLGTIEGVALENVYTFYIVRIDRSKPLHKDFDIYPYECISISNNFIKEVK